MNQNFTWHVWFWSCWVLTFLFLFLLFSLGFVSLWTTGFWGHHQRSVKWTGLATNNSVYSIDLLGAALFTASLLARMENEKWWKRRGVRSRERRTDNRAFQRRVSDRIRSGATSRRRVRNLGLSFWLRIHISVFLSLFLLWRDGAISDMRALWRKRAEGEPLRCWHVVHPLPCILLSSSRAVRIELWSLRLWTKSADPQGFSTSYSLRVKFLKPLPLEKWMLYNALKQSRTSLS